ncbi:MAG: hypothetical protein EOP10_18765 [Proteobacteria bacterium]|nr:MAG: hypothetical protein EOP10_18765 [Pseudomonadota bacterium]
MLGMSQRSREERLQTLLEQRAQIDARLNRLRAEDSAKKRKLETRMKILVGAVVMKELARNEELRALVYGELLPRELLIAFPDQLSPEQRRETLTEFLASEVVGKGMVADYAIHAPGRGGDERNHHAHVLLTMRSIEDGGFGNKRREWNSPDVLRSWREEWANALNRTFERHGITDDQGEKYRVDHRSYEEQGIEREPGVHLGPAVTALERRGVSTERGDANREIYGRNAEIQMLRRQAQQIGSEVLKLQEELRMPTRRQAHRSLRFIEDGENARRAENDNDFDLGL